MSVSVHSISMLYELRALRSRLAETLASADGLFNARELRAIEWGVAMCDSLINKTERTGEYIGALEAELDSAASPEEAGLG